MNMKLKWLLARIVHDNMRWRCASTHLLLFLDRLFIIIDSHTNTQADSDLFILQIAHYYLPAAAAPTQLDYRLDLLRILESSIISNNK